MAKKITDEEFAKVKRGIAREQAVLMLNLSEVVDEVMLFPETRRGYKYFSCISSQEPAFINNYLFGNEYFSLVNLKPYQLSIFNPKLRFYKRLQGGNKLVEIPFDDYLGSGEDDKLKVSLDRYNPQRIINEAAFNGTGIGIQRFEWKLSGDITDTPDKRLQTYSADLTLKVENMSDLFARRTDGDGNVFTVADLFSVELGRPSSKGANDKSHQLFVEVGWHVAAGNTKNNQIYDSIDKRALEAIDSSSTVFKLSLKDHNIDFQQNGSIVLTLNYIASLAADASDPLKSNAINSETRQSIERDVVFAALNKALAITDDEVSADETGDLGAKKARAMNWVDLRKQLQEPISSLQDEKRVVGGYKEFFTTKHLDQVKKNKNYVEQYDRMFKIFAELSNEHAEEIDRRVQEANAVQNCQWFLDGLYKMNRIKVFQVQRENILATQQVIKRETVVERHQGSVRDGTKREEDLGKVKTRTETTVPPGYVKGIDERFIEAGVTIKPREAGAFTGMIFYDKTLKIKDTMIDPPSDNDIEARVVIESVYPDGASTPKAKATVKIGEDTFQDEFDLSLTTGVRGLGDFLKEVLEGYVTETEDIGGPNANSTGAVKESDVAYTVIKTALNTVAKVHQIESEFAAGPRSYNPLNLVRNTKDEETESSFIQRMRKAIVSQRAVTDEDGENAYLNVRYVTVGDVFDALLEHFYIVNTDFRDKFLLGPVVVNEASYLIGSTEDLTIKYGDADTKLMKLEVTKDPKTKKPKVNRKEISKARQDNIYYLADMPISLDAILLWMQKNISENANKIFTFDKFISSLFSTILNDSYSETGEFREIMPYVSLSTTMDTFILTQKKSTNSSETYDMFGLGHVGDDPLAYPKRDINTDAKMTIDKDAHRELRKHMPKNMAYQTSKAKGGRQVTYHLIGTKCKFPDKREYNYLKDMQDGIPHFFVGQDSGIVKSIEFSQADIPGLLEKNILNAQNSAKNELGIATAYTRKVYNATVNLVGNTFFSRGQYLFINPTMAGAGSMRDEKSAASRMGLGGYYIITDIANSIDASGRYDTQLECVWQSSGLGVTNSADDNSPAPDQILKGARTSEEYARLQESFHNTLSKDLTANTVFKVFGLGGRRGGAGVYNKEND